MVRESEKKKLTYVNYFFFFLAAFFLVTFFLATFFFAAFFFAAMLNSSIVVRV